MGSGFYFTLSSLTKVGNGPQAPPGNPLQEPEGYSLVRIKVLPFHTASCPCQQSPRPRALNDPSSFKT